MIRNYREEINFLKENKFYKFPISMQLEITRECPFNCPQCYKINIEKKHMEFEVFKEYVLYGIARGTKLIVINGGEPLLHPSFNDMLLFLNKIDNLNINCFSSGFGLTEKTINIISKSRRLNFYISLNGSTKEINDLSREGYEISIGAIQKLSSQKCKFHINWVARKDNVHDLQNIIDLCKRYKASSLSITSNKLSGFNRDVLLELTSKELEKIISVIKNNTDLLITTEACFPQLTAKIREIRSTDGCAAGLYNMHIDVGGNFSPCTHLHYKEKFQSIEEYWLKSSILKSLRENPVCNLCDIKCRFCKAMSTSGYNDFQLGMKECILLKERDSIV